MTLKRNGARTEAWALVLASKTWAELRERLQCG